MTGDPGRGRRELAVAVMAGAAGAALALWVASRTWVVEVTPRPQPLPALDQPRTGGSLVPALPACAVVALAGAGALLATRGRGRLGVGAVLVLSGFGMLGASGYALAELPTAAAVWPVLAAAAGLAVAVVGVLAIRRGCGWPGMGDRFERARGGRHIRPSAAPGVEPVAHRAAIAAPSGERAPRAQPASADSADSRARLEAAHLWDAIDRREDPTITP